MKTITTIILLCLITQVLQTNGLIQLKNSLATSDSPLLMKILQLVDAATSDEHLLQITLKLLRSLCICMRETLKGKEDYFNIDHHSLEPAVHSGNEGKVYDLYRNIYNNTCFNLRQELTNHTQKFMVEEESAFLNHTNCGKDERNETYNKSNDSDKSSAVKYSISSRLEYVLFKALIQTKDLHEYRLRRYGLFGKEKPQTESTLRNCLIVILTLYPNDQEIFSKHNIEGKDLNNTLYTKSPIDVDIINSKHDQKRKDNGESIRAEKISECNLRSLYNFLTESDRKKLIKVYKFIRKRDTIKIYIEVNIGQNHTNLIDNCCENGTVIPQCNKDLINDFITQPNFLDDTYINTITNIKSLVQQYETKLNNTKHYNISATTVQVEKKEEKIIVESTTKPSTYGNKINPKENDMHLSVTKSNESSKLGDVTHAIVLLNDFVSKQNTKSYLKTYQTDKIDPDKPWTDYALKEELQQENTSTCNPINISTTLDVKGQEQKSQHKSTSSLLLYESNKTTFKPHETRNSNEKTESPSITLPSFHEKHEVIEASTSRIDVENVVNHLFTINSSSANNYGHTELYTADIMQNTSTAHRVTVTPNINEEWIESTSQPLNTNKMSNPDSRITQNTENNFKTYLVHQNGTSVSDSRSAMTTSTVQTTKTTLHYSLYPDMVSLTNNTTFSIDLQTNQKKIPEEYSVADYSTTQKTIPISNTLDVKDQEEKSQHELTSSLLLYERNKITYKQNETRNSKENPESPGVTLPISHEKHEVIKTSTSRIGVENVVSHNFTISSSTANNYGHTELYTADTMQNTSIAHQVNITESSIPNNNEKWTESTSQPLNTNKILNPDSRITQNAENNFKTYLLQQNNTNVSDSKSAMTASTLQSTKTTLHYSLHPDMESFINNTTFSIDLETKEDENPEEYFVTDYSTTQKIIPINTTLDEKGQDENSQHESTSSLLHYESNKITFKQQETRNSIEKTESPGVTLPISHEIIKACTSRIDVKNVVKHLFTIPSSTENNYGHTELYTADTMQNTSIAHRVNITESSIPNINEKWTESTSQPLNTNKMSNPDSRITQKAENNFKTYLVHQNETNVSDSRNAMSTSTVQSTKTTLHYSLHPYMVSLTNNTTFSIDLQTNEKESPEEYSVTDYSTTQKTIPVEGLKRAKKITKYKTTDHVTTSSTLTNLGMFDREHTLKNVQSIPQMLIPIKSTDVTKIIAKRKLRKKTTKPFASEKTDLNNVILNEITTDKKNPKYVKEIKHNTFDVTLGNILKETETVNFTSKSPETKNTSETTNQIFQEITMNAKYQTMTTNATLKSLTTLSTLNFTKFHNQSIQNDTEDINAIDIVSSVELMSTVASHFTVEEPYEHTKQTIRTNVTINEITEIPPIETMLSRSTQVVSKACNDSDSDISHDFIGEAKSYYNHTNASTENNEKTYVITGLSVTNEENKDTAQDTVSTFLRNVSKNEITMRSIDAVTPEVELEILTDYSKNVSKNKMTTFRNIIPSKTVTNPLTNTDIINSQNNQLSQFFHTAISTEPYTETERQVYTTTTSISEGTSFSEFNTTSEDFQSTEGCRNLISQLAKNQVVSNTTETQFVDTEFEIENYTKMPEIQQSAKTNTLSESLVCKSNESNLTSEPSNVNENNDLKFTSILKGVNGSRTSQILETMNLTSEIPLTHHESETEVTQAFDSTLQITTISDMEKISDKLSANKFKGPKNSLKELLHEESVVNKLLDKDESLHIFTSPEVNSTLKKNISLNINIYTDSFPKGDKNASKILSSQNTNSAVQYPSSHSPTSTKITPSEFLNFAREHITMKVNISSDNFLAKHNSRVLHKTLSTSPVSGTKRPSTISLENTYINALHSSNYFSTEVGKTVGEEAPVVGSIARNKNQTDGFLTTSTSTIAIGSPIESTTPSELVEVSREHITINSNISVVDFLAKHNRTNVLKEISTTPESGTKWPSTNHTDNTFITSLSSNYSLTELSKTVDKEVSTMGMIAINKNQTDEFHTMRKSTMSLSSLESINYTTLKTKNTKKITFPTAKNKNYENLSVIADAIVTEKIIPSPQTETITRNKLRHDDIYYLSNNGTNLTQREITNKATIENIEINEATNSLITENDWQRNIQDELKAAPTMTTTNKTFNANNWSSPHILTYSENKEDIVTTILGPEFIDLKNNSGVKAFKESTLRTPDTVFSAIRVSTVTPLNSTDVMQNTTTNKQDNFLTSDMGTTQYSFIETFQTNQVDAQNNATITGLNPESNEMVIIGNSGEPSITSQVTDFVSKPFNTSDQLFEKETESAIDKTTSEFVQMQLNFRESKFRSAYDITKSEVSGTNVNGSTESSFYKPHRMQTTLVNESFTSYVTESSTLTKETKNYTENSNAKHPKSSKRKIKLKNPIAFELNIRVGVEANKDGIKFSVLDENERVYSKTELPLLVTTYFHSNRSDIIEKISNPEKRFVNETKINNTASLTDIITNSLMKNMNMNRRSHDVTTEDLIRIAAIMQKLKKKPPVVNTKFPQRKKTRKTLLRNTTINEEIQPHQINTTNFNASKTPIHTNFTNIKHKSKMPGSLTEESLVINHIQSIYKEGIEKIQESMNNTKQGNISGTDVLKEFYQAIVTLPVVGNINNSRFNMSGINSTLHKYENQEELKAGLAAFFRAKTDLVKSESRINKNNANKTSTLIKNKIDKLLKKLQKGKNLSKSQMRKLKRKLLKKLTSKKNVTSVHKFHDTVEKKYSFNMTTNSDQLTTATPLSYDSTIIVDGNATRIQKVETLTSSSSISKMPNKKVMSLENNKTKSNVTIAKEIQNKQISAKIISNTTGKFTSQGARRLLSHQIELVSSKLKPETMYQYRTTESNIGFNKYETAITPVTKEKRHSGMILSEIDEDTSETTNAVKGTQSTFDELNDFIKELNNVSSQESSNKTTSYVDVNSPKITNKGKSSYKMSTIVTAGGNTTAVTTIKSKTAVPKYGIMTAPFQTTVAINATDTPLIVTGLENTVPNKLTIVNEDSKHTVAMTTVNLNTFDKFEVTLNDNMAVVAFPLSSNIIVKTKVLPHLNKPNDNITQNIYNVTTKIHDMKYYNRFKSAINKLSAGATRDKSEEIVLSSPPEIDILPTYFPEVESSSVSMHIPIVTVFTGTLNKQTYEETVTEESLDMKKSHDIKYGNLSENYLNYFTDKSAMRSSNFTSRSTSSNEQMKTTLQMFYDLSTLLHNVQSLSNTKNPSTEYNYPTTANVLEHNADTDESTSKRIKERYKRTQNEKKTVLKETADEVNDNIEITNTSTVTYPSNMSINIREEIITTQHLSEDYFINTANDERHNQHTYVNTIDIEEYEGKSLSQPPVPRIPAKILSTEKKHEENALKHEIQIINATNYNKITTTNSTEGQYLCTNSPSLIEKTIENLNEQRNAYLQISQNIKKEHLVPKQTFSDGNYISSAPVKLTTTNFAHTKTSQITWPPQFSKVLSKPHNETQNLLITTHMPLDDDSVDIPAFMETTIKKQNYLKTEPTFILIDHYTNPTDTAEKKVNSIGKDNTNLMKLKVKNETYINLHKDIRNSSYSSLTKKDVNIIQENENKNNLRFDLDRLKSGSVNTAAKTVTTLTFKDYEIATITLQSNEIFVENVTQPSNLVYEETTLPLPKGIYKNVVSTSRSNIIQDSTDLTLVSNFVNTSAIIAKIYLLDPYTRQIVANKSIENKNVIYQTIEDNVTESNNINMNSPIATQDIIAVTDSADQVTNVSTNNTSLSEIKAYDKILDTKLINSNKTQLLYCVDKSVNMSGTKIRNIIKASKTNAYDQRDLLVSVKQNRSIKVQVETPRNNTKRNFFLNVFDDKKNYSIIRTPTLTHVKITKMNPVNKKTVNLKPEVQKLLLIPRTDLTYQTATMGNDTHSNSKTLLPIESRDFERKKTIQIFSSRLNRPHSSVTTATAITKNIKYNTYRPISKEELELLKYYKEHVSNTALDKQVSKKPHLPVPGFHYSSNERISGVSSSQSESNSILRVANYSVAGKLIHVENQGHNSKGLHLALEKKNLNQPLERIKIPNSAGIDRISHPILEININSPEIRTNGDSPPMIEINGNPLPIEINRNSAPMELNRNSVLMNSNQNPVPTGINRNSGPMEINGYSVPIEIDRNPVGNNRNLLPIDMNRSPVPLDMYRYSVPVYMNRNSVQLDVNRNLAPMVMNRNPERMDINRNSASMDINRNSAPMDVNRNPALLGNNQNPVLMDMNRNLIPFDVNRNSAPIVMNRSQVSLDINRNSATMDMNRNSVPSDMTQNSAPMVMNRSPVPSDMIQSSAPMDTNRKPGPLDMNRNSAPMDTNRNPMPLDINSNAVPMEINRNPMPLDINSNSVPMEINRNTAPMDNNQNPVPMDLNRSPVSLNMNRNSAPIDMNRNLVPMDNNKNSAAMDVNRNPVPLDLNRNAAPMDMNRNPVLMDINRNSATMDMSRNPAPLDMTQNSAPMEINRSLESLNMNRTSVAKDMDRNLVPMDINRNSVTMDMNRNPVPFDLNRNSAAMFMNRSAVSLDINRISTTMDINRNPVPSVMTQNSAPMDTNIRPEPLDLNRNSASIDMNRNPVPMDINRNSATIDMNRNPIPLDVNRNSVPMDMNRYSAPMNANRNPMPLDINSNSVPMETNNNPAPINIQRDSVPIEITRNPILQKNYRSFIPEETNKNSVSLEINRHSPRTFEINRNVTPTPNLNKNSPTVINPPLVIDKNINSHKETDNNRHLLADNKNTPLTAIKPFISASVFYNNGNLIPMIDNNSPSVHNSKKYKSKNLPAVIDINRYSLVVNKKSPSIIHNKWDLVSMIGNNYKNSPSIPDSNEKSSIGTDIKRNGTSMTDNNKKSQPVEVNRKTKKKSAVRNVNNQINNSTITTKIISTCNMDGIKKPEAIVAAKKKILPMKEIKRKPLLTFGDNKKSLSITRKNRKTHGALEINRNKHSNIVTKNFKQIGAHKEKLLDSFEKSNPYSMKIKEPKSQKPGMKKMKIGIGRKALMTMNTKDFLSQHRYVTPRSGVQKITKPYPTQRSVRKSILRPRFDNIKTEKRIEHKLKPKPVFINNDIFQTNSMLERLSNKIHQKLRLGQNIGPKRSLTKKAKVNKKDIADPMSYMFTADYMKMTRRPAFNDRLHVQKDSNAYENNYSPSPSYRRSFIEKSSTEVGRTPRRGRTIFFLSPTVAYDQYN